MQNQDPQDKVVISSFVVQTRGDRTLSIGEAIRDCEGATIVTEHEHKFAVVLEAASSEALASKTDQIRSIEGVTGVRLVAHFFEEEISDD